MAIPLTPILLYNQLMAKTSGELNSTFWNAQRQSVVKIINATAGQTVGLRHKTVSRRVKNRLRTQSAFSQASIWWKSLDDTQRTDWQDVAASYGLKGWQLFVQRGVDQWQRGPVELGAYSYGSAYFGLGSDLENLDTSALALYKCGELEIFSAVDVVELTQSHPTTYLVRQRNPQSNQVFETVEISEALALPLTIAVSYRTMLDEVGDNPSAEFIAKIVYRINDIISTSEQGFSLVPNSDWQRNTITITATPGVIVDYSLCFRVTDYVGTLAFDNVEATHTATNWARDPFCNNVAPVILPQWGDIIPTWELNVPANSAVISTISINDLSLE